jgi:Ras-related protein Rab-6A
MSFNLQDLSPIPIYKLILIGSSSVGKTALCDSLQGRIFNERTPLTIGVDFTALEFTDETDGIIKSYNVQLWDTAGHETFRSIAKSYYRNSQIILLCFDLTNRTSFIELEMWIDEINYIIDKHVYICLVGLKSDLEPVVNKDEINLFLEKHLILSYKTYTSKFDDNSIEIKKILLNLIKKYDFLMEDYQHFKEIDSFDLKENTISISIDDRQVHNNNESTHCC